MAEERLSWWQKGLRDVTKYLVRNFIAKPIITMVSIGFMWGFHSLTRYFPGGSVALARWIARTYFTPPREWAGFITEYISQMTGQDMSEEIESLISRGVMTGGRGLIQSVGETFLSPMLNLILPGTPFWDEIRRERLSPEEVERLQAYALDPIDGMLGAERFLGVNLQFQMGAWFLHLIGDVASFGMFKSLKDLPNAISWSYGIGWLSWLVMGTPFRITIGEPFEKLLNRYYLPADYTLDQAVDLWNAELISSAQLMKTTRELGYHPEKTANLAELKLAKLSMAELRTLYRQGAIATHHLDRELKLRGYTDGRISYIKWLWDTDGTDRLIDDIVDEAGRVYVEGAIDEEMLRYYLRFSYLTNTEKDLLIQKLNLEKVRRSQLTDAQILRCARRGTLGYYEARDRLMNRGWSREDAELLLDTEAVVKP